MSTEAETVDAPPASSPGPETAPVERAEAVSEGTAPSTTGDPADQTPPAKTEFDEFKADVAKATGTEPEKPEAESKTEEAEPKTDEPGAVEGEEKADALSQESEVPQKLTERPEWQALTKIGDKLGPAAGKEVRKVLRGVFKREHDLTQAVAKLQPAGEVMDEMLKSVGGSEVGFKNMRHLITSFDADPANAVPMLEKLLDDAKKRAGLVIQSPDLVDEVKTLDQKFADGLVAKPEYEKRKQELLELQKARVGQERTTQQTERQRREAEQTEAQKREQAWVTETNQAEANWVAQKLKSDPDFEAVKDIWSSFSQQKALKYFNETGKRPDGKMAVKILDEALKDAKAQAMKFKPRPRAIQPVHGGDGSSGKTRQQPATEFDEFKQAVEDAKKRH